MNALNAEVQAELKAAADEAAERKDVRAVVVYGGDEGVRCGSGHQGAWPSSPTRTWSTLRAIAGRPSQRLAHIPKPTVAAVTASPSVADASWR